MTLMESNRLKAVPPALRLQKGPSCLDEKQRMCIEHNINCLGNTSENNSVL